MSTLREIEAAIERLPAVQLDELAFWLEQRRARKPTTSVSEPDFLGRAYEYLLRKFAEGQGQSAGEFYTPRKWPG